MEATKSIRARVATCVALAVALGCEGGDASMPPGEPPSEAPEPLRRAPAPMPADFVAFESGPVRPLALSGDRLVVVNTPDARLEVFDVSGEPTAEASVPVGLEPVAVAFADHDTAWVVNHVSDSVSIVDLAASPPRVTGTLLVGDAPRDIVFAEGTTGRRAFITTAHRGQQRTDPNLGDVPGAGDPQLTTPSVPRADVWVFDVDVDAHASLGGRPEAIVELFGDTPRALAVSPDERTVYAAVFHSGNQTTAVHEGVLCAGFTDDRFGSRPCTVEDRATMPGGLPEGRLPGGRPAPGRNAAGEPQPWTSMIVRYDAAQGAWLGPEGRNFSNAVRFSLPDHDVFAIDAETLEEQARFDHVGTVLFSMAVDPESGTLLVANQEANNHVRFEGAGEHGGTTVQGSFAQARLSLVDPVSGRVRPRHLNRHIDYDVRPAPPGTAEHSLATPVSVAVHAGRAYVAAFGSSRVGVVAVEALSDDSAWDGAPPEWDPTEASADYLDVTGGGPSGLAVDAARERLFVTTRFDNGLSVVSLAEGREVAHVRLRNPEPGYIVAGRPLLYDARRTSSNGEASCAGCHVFGDVDGLSWDLGDPDAANTRNPQQIELGHTLDWDCAIDPSSAGCLFSLLVNGDGGERTFASMKGPMVTQTLRGMRNGGHMHWRGDRATGYFGTDTPGGTDSDLSFRNFIAAFPALNGLNVTLPANARAADRSEAVRALEEDVAAFSDFALALSMPPNAVRPFDNVPSAAAQAGFAFFHGDRRSDGLAVDVSRRAQDGFTCEGCHRLDAAAGFYGTGGAAAFTLEIQITKIPHLRNLYTRVGMFGLPERPGFLPSDTADFQGPQVRGFGMLHDGATDTFFNFLGGSVFDDGESSTGGGLDLNDGAVGIPDEATRRSLEQYMFEFEGDLAPIVGQQITLVAGSHASLEERLDLLESRARAAFVDPVRGGTRECDLVAEGVLGGSAVAYLYDPERRRYAPNRTDGRELGEDGVRALGEADVLTFTCLPPGSGHRHALDRDRDGQLDGDR